MTAFNKFNFDPEEGFMNTDFYEETPANAREILQRQHNQTRDFINEVVDILKSSEEGESGAEAIGSAAIEGVAGSTVHMQLWDIFRQLQDASAGTIPDASITAAKLASESVTAEKIAGGTITTGHFSSEAVCPKAADTEKVNGYAAAEYTPLSAAVPIGILKNRFSDLTVSDVSGITDGDYRYIISSRKVIKLNLADSSYEEYADLSSVNADKYSLVKIGGYIYAVCMYIDSSGNNYCRFYKITDSGVTLEKQFKWLQSTLYQGSLVGAVMNSEGKLIVAAYISVKSFLYFFVLDYDELPESSTISESKFYSNVRAHNNMFIAGDRIFIDDYVFSSSLEASHSGCQYIAPTPKGDILISEDSLLFADGDTLEVKWAIPAPLPLWYNTVFFWNDFMFVLAGKYLFKVKIYPGEG